MQDELGALAAFVAVADARSFTRAAGKLGTSQSALSHKIRRLEARLGVKLLTRTTRSVAPTEAGHKLLATLAPALAGIKEQLVSLTDDVNKVSGTIRITTADHATETLIWPALKRILPAHPNLAVEIDVDNRFVDIVAEGYNAGVRLGANVDKDMIAVSIGPPQQKVVVGAPAYFARRGTPTVPADLSAHDCLNRKLPSLGGYPPWSFARDGRQVKVRVTGQLAFNRPELIADAAIDGFGVAYLFESQVSDAIKSGKLVCVLQDWCGSVPGYHLYYPMSRQVTPAFQVIIDALRRS
ncbi:LysR family transcriptional regulator [Pigmentiphaga aceris]|uniref:LysR family transcriptional regulator n=1 Tax=Pigmentiphaga aceris TaxID=1940612 RepID=A0A5C0B4Q4_9BURK|nr:LysR family transcriptional regulator [Pigmentiphaga aceris]QEI08240.1 LysR family transcriptional regulator [Pigmentiphaga aceris]